MRRGAPDDAFEGQRPQIAIANTASDLTPCNSHLDEVARSVRDGVFAAGGWVDDSDPPSPLGVDVLGGRTGGLFSIGAGVGLLFDIIRVDVARGLGGGGVWEVIVEANPSFWDFL